MADESVETEAVTVPGAEFAVDDIAGVKYPITKIGHGDDGVLPVHTSAANPLPVQIGDGTDTANVTAGGRLEVDGSGVTQPVSNTTLSVVGGGTEATALRVTVASDSTGVLSVDDNGGSLTVDGTVTASMPNATASGALGALDAAVAIAVDGSGGVGWEIDSGLSGTVTPEATTDGTNWFAVPVAAQTLDSAFGTSVGVFPNRGKFVNPSGYAQVRLRVSAYTSGSSAARLIAARGVGDLSRAYIAGLTPSDTALQLPPVIAGARASAAVPSNVSADGDAVNVWALRSGALATQVTAGGALIGGDAGNGLDVDVTRVQGTVTVGDGGSSLTVDGSISTQGIGVHDAPATSSPHRTGGYASATAPTDVADGDTVNNWSLRNGSQVVTLSSGGALLGATEDDPAAANPSGIPLVARRKDTLSAAEVSDDGDYIALNADSSGRMRANAQASGIVGHDSPAAGTFAPVLIGGYASAAVPTAVSADGDAVNAWHDRRGAYKVALVDDAGDSTMDGTNNALRVNVVAGSAGGTEYTEDAAAPADPQGGTLLATRDDQLSTLTEVEGDWTRARATSKGALWVALADSAGDPITSFGGGTQYTEDAAAAANPVGTALNLIRADTSTSLVDADGDNVAARGSTRGELYTRTPNIVASSALGGLDQLFDIDVLGAGCIAWEVDTGTLVGTISFEATTDNSTWFAVPAIRAAGMGPVVTAITSFGDRGKILSVSGWRKVRMRVSAYTSGTSNARMESGPGSDTAYSVARGVVAHDDNLLTSLFAPLAIGARASAAAPSAVSADNDATYLWATPSGALATQVTAAGALIGGDATNGLDVDVTRAQGYAAQDAAIAGNPLQMGGRASNALPTAVSADGDAVYARHIRTGEACVVGSAAHDAAFNGPPVLVGAYASAAAPSAVSSNGDVVNLWANFRGALQVGITDGATGDLIAGDPTNGLDVDVTRVQGTVTVDTELPAAAVLGDNTSNPTAPAVGSFPHWWDGTNWDRAGGTFAGGLFVSGAIAHDGVVATSRPLISGGVASAAAPADVSADGDSVSAWHLRNGAQVVNGDVAHDSADIGLPLKVGAKAANALPTAVANNDRANAISDLFGRILTGHIDPAMQVHINKTYTTQQTGTDVWDPAAGKKIAVTSVIIASYGTTAGRVILWFGDNADTTFTQDTDQVLCAASFVPSTVSTPGMVYQPPVPVFCTTADRELHITTDAAISIDVTIEGYEW